jgi:hypothetical protein
MTAFSTSGGAQVSVNGGLTPVSTPVIANLELSILATEYTQVVNTGTKRIEIRNRQGREMRLSYTPGGTTLSWITIPIGSSYFVYDLDVVTLSLYLNCPAANNTIAEITLWS